jgi:hypothetical protein
MSTKTHFYLKIIPAGRALVIGVIVILAITGTTGFVWIQTDQVIATPGLRVLDWVWRVFVCRCAV